MREIHILLTHTHTYFSRMITCYTKEPYAHASIVMNARCDIGYSFGRKWLRNPFIGGFNIEKYLDWVLIFPNTQCCLYSLQVTDEQYEQLELKLANMVKHKSKYKYNLLGVLGRCLDIKIKRNNTYFCTQFVATLLEELNILKFKKEPICVTARDFQEHGDLTKSYEGYLKDIVFRHVN